MAREAVEWAAWHGTHMAALILIVDDDPIQRRLLEAMGRQFGYEVETAASGEEALTRLESQSARRSISSFSIW